MSNHNKGNNKQQRNYFTQNISVLGEDFLEKKNSRDLQRESSMVTRELTKGLIDVYKYGKYLLHPKFSEAMINYLEEKYAYHNVSYSGVAMLNERFPEDNAVITTLEKHRLAKEGYAICLENFYKAINNNDYRQFVVLVNNVRSYARYL